MIYFIIFLLLLVFALLDFTKITGVRKAVYFGSVFFLILMSGLRWRTGADWLPYSFYFDYFEWGNIFSMAGFEPGFMLLNAFSKIVLNGNFTVLLFFQATLTIVLRALFLKKYVHSFLLALLLFWGFTLAEVMAVRQGIAISIVLLGIPFIQQKKFFKFFFLVVIAATFHLTAIIFLLAYPVYYANWSIKTRVALLVLSIFLGMSGILITLMDLLGNLGIGRLSGKSAIYANQDQSDMYSADQSYMTIATGILKRAVIFPILFYFEYKIESHKNFVPKISYRRVMNLFVFGNMLYFMVITFLAVQRIASYFYPLEIILLCMIFDYQKGINKKIWFWIFVLYALAKLALFVFTTSDYLIPYYWIFSDSFFREAGTNF